VSVDVAKLRRVHQIDLGGPPPAFVAADGRWLWASQPILGTQPGTVSLIDLASARVVRRRILNAYTVEIAAGSGAAWVGLGDRGLARGCRRVVERGAGVTGHRCPK